jgi:hypothetical protein
VSVSECDVYGVKMRGFCDFIRMYLILVGVGGVAVAA